MEVVRWFQALMAGADLPDLPVVAFPVPEEVLGNRLVDENFVAAAHGAGIAVHVWTINEPEAMARLADLGVDGIMTDRPSELAAVLGERSWKRV
jgi:glycerophosphoryl diester phosphodiesterase